MERGGKKKGDVWKGDSEKAFQGGHLEEGIRRERFREEMKRREDSEIAFERGNEEWGVCTAKRVFQIGKTTTPATS